MGNSPEEPAGVAIVRAWIELGPPRTLKVRIVTAPDVNQAVRVIGMTADIDEACSIVRDWLAGIADATSKAANQSDAQ